MDDKEVKNALEDHSYHDAWTRIYRAPDHEAYFNYVFDRIDRVYRDTAPGAVLDAGCGTGNHIRHLTAIGYDVHGVDYSPVAVERCRKELARIENGRHVDVQQADILALPFADGAFTRVLCWGVLMHIPSVEKAIAELCRVTAPGGRMIIGELNKDAWQLKLAALVRKWTGRKVRGDYRITPAGIEAWDGTPGHQLVARKADIGWTILAFEAHGTSCIGRYAGEFTEWYAETNRPLLRKLVHAFNRIWYSWIRAPGPAVANILVFEKNAE